MKKLFELFKYKLIKHPKYQGIVCGYNAVNFFLAVESTNTLFMRKLPPETFILEEFKDGKYRYIAEDEREIEKQLKYDL